jgi:beta-xylosidase
VLYEGNGEAEVVGGQTTTATIVVEEATGHLEVVVVLPTGFVDYFDDDELSEAWSWIREDPSLWSLTENPGNMRMYTHGDIFESSNNAPVLIRECQHTDFTIVTKVSISASVHPLQAGLVVYGDDDNYVRLTRGYWNYIPGQGVEMVLEIAGEGYYYPQPSDAQPAWLKIKKQGDVFQGFISDDGIDYVFVNQVNVDLGSDIWIGLVSISAGAYPEIPADFDYFEYSLE